MDPRWRAAESECGLAKKFSSGPSGRWATLIASAERRGKAKVNFWYEQSVKRRKETESSSEPALYISGMQANYRRFLPFWRINYIKRSDFSSKRRSHFYWLDWLVFKAHYWKDKSSARILIELIALYPTASVYDQGDFVILQRRLVSLTKEKIFENLDGKNSIYLKIKGKFNVEDIFHFVSFHKIYAKKSAHSLLALN